MRRFLLCPLLACLLVCALPAAAQRKPERAPQEQAAPAAEAQTAEEFEAQLRYQQGRVELPGGFATLNVPAGFRYLNPEQSELILTEAWGNPPGRKTLGMLFPADVSPLAEEGWGVVITYEEDGHVADDEAGSINYTEMLKEMKSASVEENKERQQQGYEPIEIVGWAKPPHYDRATHKLYWARELKFGDSPAHTLNYDIRVLGRKGVLSLNAVAAMGQLGAIERDMQTVLGFVDFNPGQRYADFKPGYDKVATYGIAALIAGKVAAKAGFFKLLIAALIAGKKFVLLGLAGLGVALRQLFKRKAA
jgi:uncharacterized membrane-anchored protein